MRARSAVHDLQHERSGRVAGKAQGECVLHDQVHALTAGLIVMFSDLDHHVQCLAISTMSRNAWTRGQLLSVYYNFTPFHARFLNVLLSMGIKIHRALATKQALKSTMHRFRPFY